MTHRPGKWGLAPGLKGLGFQGERRLGRVPVPIFRANPKANRWSVLLQKTEGTPHIGPSLGMDRISVDRREPRLLRRVEGAGVRIRAGNLKRGALEVFMHGQCRKWRRPVKTMAMPCSSQAAIDSSSRLEPPGWMMAVDAGRRRRVGSVAEGEERVRGQRRPLAPRRPSQRRSAPSRAGSSAPRRRPATGRPSTTTIAFDFTVGADLPGERRGRASSPSVGARFVFTVPEAGSASRRSQSWASMPPSIRRRSQPDGAGGFGPIARPRSIRRMLFFQVGLVVSRAKASGSKPGATIASRNRPGMHINSAVARSTGRLRPTMPPKALTGRPRRRLSKAVARSSPTAAPQGLLCLRTQAAGSSNRRINRRALSRSRMLLYDSSLPWSTGPSPGSGRGARARRRAPPLVRVLAVSKRGPEHELGSQVLGEWPVAFRLDRTGAPRYPAIAWS